ncbi:MAG: hypothetical protein ACE15E_13630 [Acidobacteriota bacterium]
METSQQLTTAFRERLVLFSFFHLGSDARIDITEGPESLKVSMAHSRVVPFDFSLSWPETEQLLADPSRFEAFMLDLLTRYRRS